MYRANWNPLHYSPNEFANIVRDEVEQKNARIVMIDSVSGYSLSLRGDDLVPIHALCKYLQNMGVAVILINEVEAITGDFHATRLIISYMADNIVSSATLEMQRANCVR